MTARTRQEGQDTFHSCRMTASDFFSFLFFFFKSVFVQQFFIYEKRDLVLGRDSNIAAKCSRAALISVLHLPVWSGWRCQLLHFICTFVSVVLLFVCSEATSDFIPLLSFFASSCRYVLFAVRCVHLGGCLLCVSGT